MIVDHRHFEFQGKTLVEKLIIKSPLEQSPVFQNEACFIYFKEGEGIITSPTENIVVENGESVLLKCGSYFAKIINKVGNGICEVFVIHLYPEILKEIYKDEIPDFITSTKQEYYTQKIVSKNVIQQFIQSLDFYFENQQVVSTELLRLKLKELILLLLETNEKPTILNLFAHLFTPRKANIVEVVNAHLFTSISLDQMSKLAGHSLSTFKREFKLHFDNTPANYIREQRMKKAAALLKTSDFSISEIAYQIGYDDSSHFSRLFSSFFKVSPTDYRLSHKNCS
jgi:AraC-like DNA-binding protein